MKNNRKRLLSLVLALCMALSLLPAISLTARAIGAGDVTYDTNGGEKADWTDYDQDALPSESPDAGARTGFRFVGWYTDSDLAENHQVTSWGTAIRGNTTLYAGWTRNTHTLTLYAYDPGITSASASPAGQLNLAAGEVPDSVRTMRNGDVIGTAVTYTVPYDMRVTLSASVKSDTATEAYRFLHWKNGSYSGSSASYIRDAQYTLTMPDADAAITPLTLSGTAARGSATVTWASMQPECAARVTLRGSTADHTVTLRDAAGKVKYTLTRQPSLGSDTSYTAAVPKVDTDSYKIWVDGVKTGSTLEPNAASVSVEVVCAVPSPTIKTDGTASAAPGVVTYGWNGGAARYPADAALPALKSGTYYDVYVDGVRVGDTGSEINYYTVTFYDGDTAYGADSPCGPQIVRAGQTATAPTATKSGFTLLGWNATGDQNAPRFDFDTPISAAAALKAVWTTASAGDSGETTRIPVIIDGVAYEIGTAVTRNGVMNVTLDQTALQKQLGAARETVTISLHPAKNADTVVTQLVVANVNEMAQKEMTLSVQVDGVRYDLRAAAIDPAALMAELGAAEPKQVPIAVTISTLDARNAAAISEQLQGGGMSLLSAPVSFSVTAGFPGKTIEVEAFERYVSRTIEVSAEVAAKLTTAVVCDGASSGGARHVPTNVSSSGGKWFAKINSLTNSTYALINYAASFADTDGKWYEAAVTEMASRGVVSGRGAGMFDGGASITRAEFAALLVRALGLPQDGDASAFTDVAKTAWYSGAVGKAYEYGLVGGRGNGVFDPAANITRQEAMAMLHRAAAITEFAGTAGTLSAFSDADSISAWALADAQWNVGSGLILGNSAGELRGQDNITRGETAAVLLRLLQKSELVDVRAKA